jgi:hypothetical protein
MDNKNRPSHGLDLSKFSPEQKLFFQAAGKYPASITAQGIELYRSCRDNGLNFNDVFDEVYADRLKLIPFTESVHQRLANQSQSEALSLGIDEQKFVGILSGIVQVTDELTMAERAGRPLSEEKLQEYLQADYKELVRKRAELKEQTEKLIEEAQEEDEKEQLRMLLSKALTQLENDFNRKVRTEANPPADE